MADQNAPFACGMSGPVGPRSFRERSGIPLIQLTPLVRSVAVVHRTEREEIALLRAQQFPVVTAA